MKNNKTIFFALCTALILLITHSQQTQCQSKAYDNAFFDNTTWSRDELFNTRFIAQEGKVRDRMHSEGFQDVSISTEDGVNLCGLWKRASNPQYTIIFTGGFYPGKKESMTPLYKHVSDNANVLFFDARGHGQSDGTLRFLQQWKYGVSDYKDIIATIEFAQQNTPTNTPIILLGICAGAFHTSRALLHLGEQGCKKYNVVGAVLDSSWGSFRHVAKTGIPAFLGKWIKNRVIRLPFRAMAWCFYYAIARPIISINAYQTRLFGKMHNIKIPLFFIHSNDDNWATLNNAIRLAKETPRATTWWIEESRHALHHLKHKYESRKRLTSFVDGCLQCYYDPIDNLSVSDHNQSQQIDLQAPNLDIIR